MTVTQERPAESADVAITPTVRSAARRAAFWVGAALVAILFALATALFARGASVGPQLGADNAAPGGSMALVEVLKRQGVDVVPTESLVATADAIGNPASTTILLYDRNFFLDDDQLAELGTLADRLVIVDPTFDQLDALAPEVAQAGEVEGPLDADCALPAAQRAEHISGDLYGYRVIDEGSGAVGCFGSGDDVVSLVETDRGVVVVGAVGAFTNGQIAQDGNAALTLNLLGEHETLIWYLPSFEDLGREPPPPSPAWLVPAILLLGATVIAAAFWRGRRFGPLVIENLPVTVRASETMLGRARLYEKSGARLRALDALRVGTAQRIARLAGLPRTAGPDEIVAAAAALTGRAPSAVRALLLDTVPGNDAELVRRSDELLLLEREVAAAVRGR